MAHRFEQPCAPAAHRVLEANAIGPQGDYVVSHYEEVPGDGDFHFLEVPKISGELGNFGSVDVDTVMEPE